MTMELVKGMTEHCLADLKPGKYVQKTEKLLVNDMSEINNKMILILDHLAALVRQKQTSESVAD